MEEEKEEEKEEKKEKKERKKKEERKSENEKKRNWFYLFWLARTEKKEKKKRKKKEEIKELRENECRWKAGVEGNDEGGEQRDLGGNGTSDEKMVPGILGRMERKGEDWGGANRQEKETGGWFTQRIQKSKARRAAGHCFQSNFWSLLPILFQSQAQFSYLIGNIKKKDKTSPSRRDFKAGSNPNGRANQPVAIGISDYQGPSKVKGSSQ